MTSAVTTDSNSGRTFCPFVSVIVPIYNGETDIPPLLEGLAAQTYPAHRVEYLMVDNASRDRTPELLQTAAQRFQDQGLTLRSLSESQIQSSYAARNVGIRAAQGDILAFTDADCRPQPTWLERLVQPFAEETVGLVAGEITALPGHTLLEQYAEQQATLSQKHTLAHAFLPYGQTANLAVRRAALLQAGLFRPYLTTGGDADLCWRILQLDPWRIQFEPTAIVQHRHRTNLPELKRQWQRYGRSNRYLHDLHGIPLMRELTQPELLYRWSRWFLKELPLGTLRWAGRRAALVDLVATPLSLICTQARSAGQRQAKLPDKAQELDRLQFSTTVKPDEGHECNHERQGYFE